MIGIGLSRYLLQMHSLPEVGLGLAVGSSALLVVPLRMLVKPVSFEVGLRGLGEQLNLRSPLCRHTEE